MVRIDLCATLYLLLSTASALAIETGAMVSPARLILAERQVSQANIQGKHLSCRNSQDSSQFDDCVNAIAQLQGHANRNGCDLWACCLAAVGAALTCAAAGAQGWVDPITDAACVVVAVQAATRGCEGC